MNLGEPVCSFISMTIKPIDGKRSQMTHWQSDQLIVPQKPGNAGGGKGLAVMSSSQGNIHQTQIWIRDGNETD